MPKNFSSLAFIASLASAPLFAQNYPYESKDSASEQLPHESPTNFQTDGDGKGRIPALFRVGLKVGGEFAILQTSSVPITVRGPVADVLASFGWDLPYQPIFFEFESGWKGFFLKEAGATSTTRINMIPLRFGVFHRIRTGPITLWKLGVVPSLDVRITTDSTTSKTTSAVVPSITFAMAVERGGLMFQPEIGIYRIRSHDSFLSFGLLAGYRF